MKPMTKKRPPQKQHRHAVPLAAMELKDMDGQKFVQSAVPRPSNPKILRKLEKTGDIKLGRTDRDTIYVFEQGDCTGWWQGNLPVAIASNIRSGYPGNRVAVLENVLVLHPLSASMDTTILVPNTTRHTFLATYMADHLANFGALDDCIFPDCKRCRRSAQCLIGEVCQWVMLFAHFTRVKSSDAQELISPGKRFNQWTFAVSHHVPIWITSLKNPVTYNSNIFLSKTGGDNYALKFIGVQK